MPWQCPICGESNKDELIRCYCGFESEAYYTSPPVSTNMSTRYSTTVFGRVPHELPDNVSLDETVRMGSELVEQIAGREEIDEELTQKADLFRANVGALHLQITKNIFRDKKNVNLLADSISKCFCESLVTRNYSPSKYYKMLHTQNGYDALIMQLANLPIYRRWGYSSTKEHASKIWPTLNNLTHYENEYRIASIAVLQIGIGYGGMFVGFMGLILSLLITMF